MTVKRFKVVDPLDQIVAAVAADGCAIIERAVPESTIDAVLSEMAPYVDAIDPGSDDFTGRNTRRAGSLIARSTASHELVMHPAVLGVAEAIIGKNATNIQLHLTQIIEIGPGEPAQLIHRDQWAWDFFPFPQGFEVELSTIWAGVDFTEENGATRVIPGSNHWDPERKGTAEETVQATMPKGSVVVYTGSLMHSGGANKSDQRRSGINVDYCLGWLRQEENQYLSCPPAQAKNLPTELARLAGYQRGGYALGYYGDLSDPLLAVHPESGLTPGFRP